MRGITVNGLTIRCLLYSFSRTTGRPHASQEDSQEDSIDTFVIAVALDMRVEARVEHVDIFVV